MLSAFKVDDEEETTGTATVELEWHTLNDEGKLEPDEETSEGRTGTVSASDSEVDDIKNAGVARGASTLVARARAGAGSWFPAEMSAWGTGKNGVDADNEDRGRMGATVRSTVPASEEARSAAKGRGGVSGRTGGKMMASEGTSGSASRVDKCTGTGIGTCGCERE